MLCTSAVLLPLVAHPVPGTQTAIGSVGLLLVLVVCLGDQPQIAALLGKNAGVLRRGPVVLVAVLVTVTLFCRGYHLWQERNDLVALGLPGAVRVRTTGDVVAAERWLVSQLRTHADTFITLPVGHNSLYFWTEMDPPTALNTTRWDVLLNRSQQEAIVRAVSQFDRPCVVVRRTAWLERVLADYSHRPGAVSSPLVMYILDNYEPRVTRGTTEIWSLRPSSKDKATRTARGVVCN